MSKNLLYYGDNLDVLRRHIKDESIDLVYLDPPFKSNQDYNVLFAEQNGSKSKAQIKAFEDTWRWDQGAAETYQEVIEGGGRVSEFMQAIRTFLGTNDMMAYLTMMAPRLMELHRVLKPTGSIYLHCDPVASHYLKILMDAIYGPMNFKNEITWKRTSAHSGAKRYGANSDTILFYTKTDKYCWNPIHTDFDEKFLRRFKRKDPDGRLWYDDNLTGAGTTEGESGQDWRGFSVKAIGRHWRTTHAELDRLVNEGKIYFPAKGGFPRGKRYLDEAEGVLVQAVWTDISPINSQAQERLGYPTQKPESLMERIIRASSNKGDTVLDPFCGCGTTIAVAQRLKRRWVGIDVTHLAITLIKHRLQDAYGKEVLYQVIGEPVSLPDAQTLAKQDPYQFQWWALGLVGARPTEQKKGSDKGIDGRLYFHDEPTGGKTKQIILSVKAGHTNVAHLRDLRGVIEREKGEIGVLISMEEPTKHMRSEAAGAGFYDSPWGKKFPRLQILTVEELLSGKGIEYPPPSQVNMTFKKAPKSGESEPVFKEQKNLALKVREAKRKE